MASSGNPTTGLSPAQRQRFQQFFAHASKAAAAGNFDYATDLLTQCIVGDPGNRLYVENFLGNLKKKYNNNKKGAGKLAMLKGAGSKGSIKKSALQKDWPGVIASGLELLKLNPWDVSTLTAVAQACDALEHEESQIAYLTLALEADIKDPDVNRLMAKAKAAQGKFDEAINCWNRVRAAKPGDEEAPRMIANLTVEKTIKKGGYEDAETSTEVMADKSHQADRMGTGGARLTPQQLLEKAIAKDPSDVSKYLDLAEMHRREDHLEQAEEVLTRALSASGGDVNVRERLEDVQVQRAREQVGVAERKAQAERTPEAIELYKKMRESLNRKELEVFASRAERYPTNLGYKYELAVRLQKAGNYSEAIKLYQEARGDAKRKGPVLVALGICFAAIKQYKLAMNNFEGALAELPDGDQRKDALYMAGKLALLGTKEYEKADKYLSELAGLDFGYKDVAALLDKLSKIREDGTPAG